MARANDFPVGDGVQRVLLAVGDVLCAGVGRLPLSYELVVGGALPAWLEAG